MIFDKSHTEPVENMRAKNIETLGKSHSKIMPMTTPRKILIGLCFSIYLPITGCDVKPQFIKDMEAGFAAEKNDAGASIAVQKYFPVDMTIEKVNEQLRLLKSEGFSISEYKYEGARNWPDGAFKPYADEGTRRNMQNLYPVGVSEFSGEKMYETHYLFFTKTAAFHITMKNGKVVKSGGSIWTSGI